MTTTPTTPTTLTTIRQSHTAKVFRFNWPKFAGTAPALLIVALAAAGVPVPPLVTGAAAVLVLGSVGSMAATWWVYDHRRVYDLVVPGSWIEAPERWATVHAGFDDASTRIELALGIPPAHVLDLGAEAGPSLQRALRAYPGTGTAATSGYLPVPDGDLDAVFLTFAAHEIRDVDERRLLFAELARILRPGGQVIVTEHVIDLANLAVYGPGAFHFRTGRTWRRAGRGTGLTPTDERRLTPFVRQYIWTREPLPR